jgi:hypothetical protein
MRPGAQDCEVSMLPRTTSFLPLGVVASVLVAACSAVAATPQPGSSAPAAEDRIPWFLAVDAKGAVVLDESSGRTVGFDRARGRVWEDARVAETSVVLVCHGACPDAVSSAIQDRKGLNPPPVRLTAKGRAKFSPSGTRYLRVLAARSATDMVTEEGDVAGRSWLRVVGPGRSVTIDVAARGYRWAESADGAWALAYPERVTATNADLMWFSHGAAGWQRRHTEKRGDFVTACLTGDGSTAVLAGERPALLRRGGARTPAGTGLRNALDCTAGRQAVALVGRSLSRGQRLTVVHGLGTRGTVRWTRELPTEANVVAHPSAPVVGIADGRSFILVDSTGETVWRRDDVRNATFTRDGQLVVVTPAGTVQWLPGPRLPMAP